MNVVYVPRTQVAEMKLEVVGSMGAYNSALEAWIQKFFAHQQGHPCHAVYSEEWVLYWLIRPGQFNNSNLKPFVIFETEQNYVPGLGPYTNFEFLEREHVEKMESKTIAGPFISWAQATTHEGILAYRISDGMFYTIPEDQINNQDFCPFKLG